MGKTVGKLSDWILLLKLSIRVQLGRRYWLMFVVVLIWPLIQALFLLLGWRAKSFTAENAQNFLIGAPLYCLAIGIGIRIIAHEIEQRTLEVGYTIPGGARRVWLSKLTSASLLLLATEVPLALSTSIFFTAFPASAFYGAFQGAVFYLVVAMWAGAWLKNELAAVLFTLIIGAINLNMTASRWSPLFNPFEVADTDASEVLAWSIQNHIGFALVIMVIAVLAFARADRREQLLAD